MVVSIYLEGNIKQTTSAGEVFQDQAFSKYDYKKCFAKIYFYGEPKI